MRVSLAPGSVPIYLAALAPKMLELTVEIADGWLGWSEVADAVLERWQAGDRGGAAGLVTDDLARA